ncbi:efflux RND transporter periplasmic adaptor subunit [Phascolarctobacterium sp.]|uniref:efflux RND transporter periplasmic adaptor subunit n=1 Tax=Phascolarctobacterium sp. TaxID=2049039 RepID=UPI0038655FD8
MNLQNRKVKIVVGILVAICLIISYRIYSNVQKEKARAERISQTKSVAVELAHPQRQTIVPQLRFSGSLDPEWQAEVAAKVDGRLEKVYVKEGDKVTKGQVLAILEQTDTDANLLSAKGSFLDARTNLRKAETDLHRYEKLYAVGAVSEQVVDDYRFARNNALAKLDAARGNLQAMESKSAGTVLVAPADGIIAKRYYQEGYYAKAGTAIFAVADISMLKTVIHIPEGQIAGVKVGNEAEISLPAYPDKKIIGKVTRIAPVADLPSHTFAAEVSVDNTQGLLAGVYANVNLQAQPKENVLTIPLHAIVMRDDQQTAFVPDEKGVVQRKVLNIGYTNDQVAEVLGGVNEDDLVVISGQNKLREGTRINLEKAGK